MKEKAGFHQTTLVDHLAPLQTGIARDDVPFYVRLLDNVYAGEPEPKQQHVGVSPHVLAAQRVITDHSSGITYFANLFTESVKKNPFDVRLKDWQFGTEDLIGIRRKIVEVLRTYVTYLISQQATRKENNLEPDEYFHEEILRNSKLIDVLSAGLEESDQEQ